MKNGIRLSILVALVCFVPLEAQPPRGFQTEPRRFSELPPPAEGHWYSRVVLPKENVIETYDTFNERPPQGPIATKRSFLLREPIPADYQPGSLLQALPKPKPGHWYHRDFDRPSGSLRVWDRTYVLNDGVREELSSFVLEEPPAPEKRAADSVAIVVPVKPPEETTPETREFRLPRGKRPLVGESLEQDFGTVKPSLPNTAKTPDKQVVFPEALVEKAPTTLTTIDWSDNQSVSADRKTELLELTKQVANQTKRWQFDLSQRFLTCTEGKCLTRHRDQELVEVPYQVGLGRVWLLTIESENLAYELESGALTSRSTATKAVQMVRRLESLQGHLELSTAETKSNYGAKIKDELRKLQELSSPWNVYETGARKRWVTRWQLAIGDQAAMHERVVRLEAAKVKLPKSLTRPSERLAHLFSKLPDAPWEMSRKRQKQLAEDLAAATWEIREDYKTLATFADTLRSSPQEYVDLLVALGAAENISVYAWTIFTELSEAP